MFPPVRLPYILPQLLGLGQPGPTLREQMMAGLLLSSPAPPALVVLQVWAGRTEAGSTG